MLETLVSIAICGFFGVICMEMAENRGRSGGLGFFLGFFCGVWAIIGYWIAGHANK